MHKRGGKRIRMDWAPDPEVLEDNPYRELETMQTDEPNDPIEGSSSTKPGRVTRLRTRGAAANVCYVDYEEEDDLFFSRKRKPTRKPAVEREKHHVEKKTQVKERPEPEVLVADKDRESNIDETSLYYIIRHSRSAIASIVDEWIESYKADRESALIALMQFFINASGCKGRITVEMQHMEHAAIIRKMTEEFDEESGEYPLIMSGQQWKKFKANFCDFVQTLVKQCQYSIIYDQYLMDHVISLLTGLSDSQVRAFRHTATLAAMKLMTALVDVALLVSINFDNAARQYDAEIIKTRDKRASDRLESLMTKRTELEENMDEIKNMLTYMFKSVFVHRYRDTLPEIRAICMMEIGVWMQKFSQNFLDDSYLKYIGWTLHDKVGDVRLRCLQALLPLYETEELKGKLELFTSKFKDRIVAMTLDKEFEVAVHAVKLVISILKIHQDILTDKDCEIVYELVYSSHRGVAQAAAEFLNVRLFCPDETAVVGLRTKRGKQRLVNTPLIRDLVQFFIESELHEHGAYLVDSFIDNNPMVKDWECMTDLLLEEPGPNEEPLDNKQESTLIEIMVSSCKQAATGEPPVGRGSSRKMNLSAKEIKQVQDDKQKLTQHFIQILPMLLHKFSADSEKLTNLLAISNYFDLDLYTTLRQEANLQALLDQMAHIMSMHSDREVLESCSKALEYLCTEGSAIYTKCDVSRSHIIDQCVNRYKEAIDEWRNLILGEEIPDADETYNVEISLKRVAILYSCHNLNQWGLFESLFKDIEDCQNGSIGDRGIPVSALIHCIEACFFSINWGVVYLENSCDPASIPSYTNELHTNLHQYIAACNVLLKTASNVLVQEAAYMSICDILVTFCKQLLTNDNTHLHKLAFEADLVQQGLLNEFVQQHVFTTLQEESHDETKIEELHKKRNILAAYCKLIVYNIIPTKAAADIFKHYLRCYNEYGDIIKTTLGKAREINKVNTAMTMCLSLVNQFKEVEHTMGRVSKQSQEFTDLKELAKRFALSFGLDAIKNREACIGLHRGGILFAITQLSDSDEPNSRLLFFEILLEFTNKLLKQDKKVVLNFLDRRINGKNESFPSLTLYRNSLLHGETDQAPTPAKKPTRRSKRGDHDQDDEENEEHSEPDI